MPSVPRYDSQQVAEAPISGAKVQSNASADLLGGAQVQQDAQLSAGLGSAASAATHYQDYTDQIRVDDAINQAKAAQLKLTFDPQAGYTNLKGIDALQRPNGQPLADEYGGHFDQAISDISAKLGNSRQRIAFQQHANEMKTQFTGQLLQHESSQFTDYAASVNEGTIASAINDTTLFYNDPDRIDKNIASIQKAAEAQGAMLGKSADWIDVHKRDLTSKAHMSAIEAAMQNNDVMYADAYLKKYSDQMNADDMLHVRGIITKQVDAQVATSVATSVMTDASKRIDTPDGARAFNIAVGTESAGRQFDANGAPLTSAKGAVGIAQVMPATGPEAAKIAGVPWDENRYKTDAAYNYQLGAAYFQKQLQDFHGNLAQAYAAYNAGPDATTLAIDQAVRERNPNWLGYLPKETQDYVIANTKKFNAGEGTFQRPTLEDVHNAIRAKVGQGASPERLKLAIDEGTRMYEDQTKAIAQKDDDATAKAMQWVTENNGGFSQMPADVRAAIPFKEVERVRGYANGLDKDQDPKDNLALFEKLTTDKAYMSGLSDSQFYALKSEFSADTFKHLATERASLLNPSGPQGAGALNTSAINQVLNDRLHVLGIDPTPKDNTSEAQRVGAVRQFVRQSILNAQATTGKMMTDAEVEKHIDTLFATSVRFRSSFLGIDTGGSATRLMTMKVGDIPGATKDALKAGFKNQGIDNPSDADLLGAYFHMQSRSTAGGASGSY
jgi:soluble lytic murein transglycosylase